MFHLSDEVDLLGWGFAQDPHEVYARLRRQPVRRHKVKTLATELYGWVVTDYDDARALLADPRLSKDVDRLLDVMAANVVHAGDTIARTPKSMLFSDPPDHTRLRRLLGNVFTMRRVERLRPWIEDLTDHILDEIPPGEEIDLVNRLAMALPIKVIGKLLGVPEERHEEFRAWNGVLASLETGAEEKRATHGIAFKYISELIEEKRRDPGDDMISGLIGAQHSDDVLTDPELLATTFLLMNAGYETTAHMISSGVHALLGAPEQLALLRADPALIPGAVEEFLRLESPLNLATIRYAAAPVPVGDLVIPQGELVFIALLAANRDEDRFASADRLDITRSSRGHLSFGHGIHHCIGAPLARMEGEIVFSKLVARFPHWELAAAPERLEWKYSAQFRGLDRLPVRLS